VRYNWSSNRDNMALVDEETAIKEAARYRRAGGRTIVDATSVGIKRDPLGLARISRATGLNVLMGSGYYVHPFHPPDMDVKSEDEIVEEIVSDLMEGVGDTGIRAGVIGEVGCSWPLTDNERKSLRASARAQKLTGAPLLIHPGRNPRAPLEIMEIVKETEGVPERAIMSHIDRTIFDFQTLDELAETGCYIEYDLFGSEASHYPLAPIDMPNDGRRLDCILHLRDTGRLNQAVIAHDICYKTRLTGYGGHGYAHIIENVVPIMRRKGFSHGDIDQVLIENPARALAFA
jgi:phosphotriesterase-related protein